MKKSLIIILAIVITIAIVLAGRPATPPHQAEASAWTGVGKTLATMLYVLGAVLVLALATLGYLVALGLWRRTHETRAGVGSLRFASERQQLDLDRERLRVTEKVWADGQGVYPLLWDGHQALDPNRGIVFSIQEGAQVLTEAIARPEQLVRLLRAAGGWPGSEKAAGHLLAQPEAAIHWPARVPLAGILDGPPSFRSLALGVTMLPDGRAEVVRADMASMVHVAVGGSSGWGKSVFLRALAYQLAQSAQPVDLALVDLEAATFAPFATCGRLLWPIADTEQDALAIFSELASELDRRKSLFARFPGVDSLSTYNAQAAERQSQVLALEPLPPIICLVDEATALLSHRGVESILRTLALRGRKFGLWLCMGGQDWKAASLDTAIRNQLSTRIQFRAMSAGQSRILLQQAGAERLDAKGRALAWLPGRNLLELQAPWVSRTDILAALGGNNGGPRMNMPAPEVNAGASARAHRILTLAGQGQSKRQICLQVFGYTGGSAFDEVSRILSGTTTTGPPQNSGIGVGSSSTITRKGAKDK